jgi:chromate transporter
MSAPSLLSILLVGYFGRRAQHLRVRNMLQCVVLASAALLVLATIPIGRDALNGPLTVAITVVALPLLLAKRINTLWIISGAALLSFTGSMLGVATVSHAPPAEVVAHHVADSGAASDVMPR